MHIEIAQAVEFLGRLLQSKVDQDTINAFKEKLTELLKIRFQDHWDPQQPYKGNGYRAISNFNGQLDPILTLASAAVPIQPSCIHAHLPRDFVLWIDPFSVSYRVGDHGNIMTLFEDRSRGRITLKMNPVSPSHSPMLPYVQPRISTPIRISPPNSPDNNVLKIDTPPSSKKDNEEKSKDLVLAN
ncbi:hypothetical protein G6F70_000016 [Rhizopus microsporus]|uniref:Anti-proliferative protein domain-containing protein n=2 Tax=Rhizopus TaxID=4842 RepID=A0A367KCS2_RHIAZ|nr:hypothetical protein G6F71_002145 [Rhizopus microsporus]RCI00043.1 hypothetical protein CU097_015390 [Rhizopus azygosporus]KAG1204879.1 hypothetical protein G6F70_000016 [Rhizopus microsporus]KAG1216511.1 hypothetical protein G6F69_000082 [Rhizopus microsporus]KAG1236966.1 hypothetical protein G6F67_001575 [Rhizopus microsporus]